MHIIVKCILFLRFFCGVRGVCVLRTHDLMQTTESDCTSEAVLPVAELLFSITQNKMPLKPVKPLFMKIFTETFKILVDE